MPSVLSEARTLCPELIDAVKAFDKIAYSRNYSQVFSDFIDWMIWQHQLQQTNENPLSNYSKEEQNHFLEAFKNIQSETRKRVSLWMDSLEKNGSDWYDPLGRLYESVTSRNKSSMLGQYFTPEHIVNLMVQISKNETTPQKVQHILDPACGSGRMGLSAAAHAMVNHNPVWITMNDIDPICTKMAAVNMCLNGVVGEALCMNGLDIKGASYNFGYRVIPAYAIYPEETREFYRMVVMMKTGQDIKKQYVLNSLAYENTYIKQANDQLLEQYQKAEILRNEQKQQQAIEEVNQKIRSRMKGSLFPEDALDVENIQHLKLQQQKNIPKKNSNKNDSDDQLSLF